MDRYEVPQTAITIALHGGHYLAIIMDRYVGPQTSITIALHRGFYLAIKMDRYGCPKTALTIALPGVSNYSLKWTVMKGTKLSLI
jgi:hypothetical protein